MRSTFEFESDQFSEDLIVKPKLQGKLLSPADAAAGDSSESDKSSDDADAAAGESTELDKSSDESKILSSPEAFEAPCKPQTVAVNFSVRRPTIYGEEVRVVGNVAALGQWDPINAAAMQWTDGHVWVGTVDLEFPPAASGNELEYKFVLMCNGQLKSWESCENRILMQPSSDGSLEVQNVWDSHCPGLPQRFGC
jgi:hypothetical protein